MKECSHPKIQAVDVTESRQNDPENTDDQLADDPDDYVEPNDWDDTWEDDPDDLPVETIIIAEEERYIEPDTGLATLESHNYETEDADLPSITAPTLQAAILDKRAIKVPLTDFPAMPDQSVEAFRIFLFSTDFLLKILDPLWCRCLMVRIYGVTQAEPLFRTSSKPPVLKSLRTNMSPFARLPIKDSIFDGFGCIRLNLPNST
jgi:hypothetical protein